MSEQEIRQLEQVIRTAEAMLQAPMMGRKEKEEAQRRLEQARARLAELTGQGGGGDAMREAYSGAKMKHRRRIRGDMQNDPDAIAMFDKIDGEEDEARLGKQTERYSKFGTRRRTREKAILKQYLKSMEKRADKNEDAAVEVERARDLLARYSEIDATKHNEFPKIDKAANELNKKYGKPNKGRRQHRQKWRIWSACCAIYARMRPFW